VYLISECIVTCLRVYRRGSDRRFELLTTYALMIRGYNLQIIDTHTHTQTSVLSLLQSPLAVAWQRVLTQKL
jgi:hypothetical protein